MRRLLSANLPEKIAAIVIAILLWQIQLRQQPVSSASFENVPVIYTQAPDGLYPTNAIKSMHVDASVMVGTEATSIDKDKITLWVDLSKGKPGKNRYRVQWSYASGNIRITPRWESIDVTLESLKEKELPVTVQINGLWETFKAGPVTINPPTVRLSGPESQLSRAHEVRAVVDLSRIDPGATTEATVQVLQMDGRPLDITTDPPRVTVSIKPVAIPPEKSLLVQPTWRGSPAPGFRIDSYEIIPNQVKIKGDAETLNNLLAVETERIDVTGITSTRVFNVRLVLPKGATADRSEVEIRVYVRRDAVAEPGG